MLEANCEASKKQAESASRAAEVLILHLVSRFVTWKNANNFVTNIAAIQLVKHIGCGINIKTNI